MFLRNTSIRITSYNVCYTKLLRGVPVVDLFAVQPVPGFRMPVGDLADHIAAGIHLAAGEFAESGLTFYGALPGGIETAAQAGGRIIADDIDFFV